MYVCIYVYIYIYTHTYIYTRANVSLHRQGSYMHTYIDIHTSMYVCVYIYIYINIYYIYIHTHTHTHTYIPKHTFHCISKVSPNFFPPLVKKRVPIVIPNIQHIPKSRIKTIRSQIRTTMFRIKTTAFNLTISCTASPNRGTIDILLSSRDRARQRLRQNRYLKIFMCMNMQLFTRIHT